MKTAFLPMHSTRAGWSPQRHLWLRRFSTKRADTETSSAIVCDCGAAHSWEGDGGDPLWAWIEAHGPHMPPLPSEPPERGAQIEFDDEGKTVGLSPAVRYPDGRVEVIEPVLDASSSSGELSSLWGVLCLEGPAEGTWCQHTEGNRIETDERTAKTIAVLFHDRSAHTVPGGYRYEPRKLP